MSTNKKNLKKIVSFVLFLIFSNYSFSMHSTKDLQKILKNDYHAIFWARYLEHKNPKLSFDMLSKLVKKNKYSYKWFIDLLYKLNQFQIIRQITPLIKATYPELLKKDADVGFQVAHALVRSHVIIQKIIAPMSYDAEAMDILVSLHNQFPSDYKIAALTSMLYDLNKEPQNAITVSEKYLNTSPNKSSNFIEYFKNAARHLKLGNMQEATKNINKSLELQPKFINGWLLSASLKEQKGNIEDAMKDCLTALEIIDEENIQNVAEKVTQYLLRLFFKQKKLQHNADTFVMKKECFTQAMQLFNQKKYKEALEYINKCLSEKLDPKKYNQKDLFTIKIVLYMQQDKQFKDWVLKETEDNNWLEAQSNQYPCNEKNIA